MHIMMIYLKIVTSETADKLEALFYKVFLNYEIYVVHQKDLEHDELSNT